jgi:hypothetical protein
MWAKGRQAKEMTSKEEALQRFPDARVIRRCGTYPGATRPIVGYGLFFNAGENWDNAKPAAIRATAEQCWEWALAQEAEAK